MALGCGNNQIPQPPFGVAVDQPGDSLIAAVVNTLVKAAADVADAQARVRMQVANAGDCPRRCPVKTEGTPTFNLVRFQVGFDAERKQWRCAITGTVTAIVTCAPRPPKPKVKP